MQLHIKALRNNSKRMFRALSADTGFDSMNDFAFAPMLASMAGNFAAPGIRSKVQFGTAWWFNDHKYGM